MAVCCESYYGKNYARAFVIRAVASDTEEFGRVAGVDVVATCAPSVAGEDGEVRAADSEGGTAVVRVAVIYVLVAAF